MAKPCYIAVNLTDPQFTGKYHAKSKHPSDFDAILMRAKERGVERMIITGTSLKESAESLELAKKYAGCHPTSTAEIDKYPGGATTYMEALKLLIEKDKGEGGSRRIISIGEIGLDYDRLQFAPKETQIKHLPDLLRLSKHFNLPLFLHSRTPESHVDLVKILKEVGWNAEWPGGVVHSFTGGKEEVDELVDMGLYIGINGCSMKTPENLGVVKHIPLDKIMLETDAPWCSITTSHASHVHLPPTDSPLLLPKVNKAEKWKEGMGVKGRMEPCEVPVIAHIVAKVKGLSIEEVADQAWRNTKMMFYPQEQIC